MPTLHTPVLDVPLDLLEVDPYPYYAQWRREAPVGVIPGFGYYVNRWDDCEYLGKEAAHLLDNAGDGVSTTEVFFGENILTMNGDPHRLFRAAIDIPLRPRTIRAFVADRGVTVAREVVDAVRTQGRADLTQDVLEKISVRVIGDMLGLFDVDVETLQRWFFDLNAGMVNFAGDGEVAARAALAMAEVDQKAHEIIERVDAAEELTVFGQLVASSREDGTRWAYEDVIGTIRLLVIAAVQEPAHGLSATLLGLLQHPEQSHAVAADHSLIPAAVHEGLRWIAPFQATQRRALTDIEVAGAVIPAGSAVNLNLASANRDETRYERPEEFDIFRKRVPLASFGYGERFCAGHLLARAVEDVALDAVYGAFPNLRLDPDAEPVVSGFAVRGVSSLPVVWDA